MSQQQGNDLAAPEPLASTGPDESAQATIEDKLDDILMRLKDCAKHEDKDHVPFGERCITRYQAKDQILAIITTETTNARINTLQELQPCDDHYDSKAVHLEDITAHIAALQEEQK